MRRTTMCAVLAVGALALAAAGCGGSKDSSATDEATVTDVATDAAATDAVDTTADTSGSTDASGDTTPDMSSLSGKCADLTGLSKDFSDAMAAASGSSGTTDFTKASEAFDSFAEQVPEEIRGDFKVLAAAFAKYAVVFKDVDLSSGQTPSPEDLQKLQQAFASLDQTEVQQASQNINAWVTKNC